MPDTLVCQPWCELSDLACDVTPDDDAETWIEIASDVLFDLTGRRWPGICQDTIRPSCQPMERCPSPVPGARLGVELVSCSCRFRGAYGLGGATWFRLPGRPVVEIVSVTIDGAVVDPADYHVVDGRDLVSIERADGTRQIWPCCQDLGRPVTAEHTWQIEYRWGTTVPVAGSKMAAILACELIRSTRPENPDGSTDCRLPSRVTSITRQGVTMARETISQAFQEGRTGIPEIDLWLSSLRVGARRRRASVAVPGRAGTHRTT